MANGKTIVTLAEVAARANTDRDFFEAVVAKATNPNSALAPFGLELSAADEDRLRAGLTAIIAVEDDFKQFGGWGRWPAFKF